MWALFPEHSGAVFQGDVIDRLKARLPKLVNRLVVKAAQWDAFIIPHFHPHSALDRPERLKVVRLHPGRAFSKSVSV